MVTGCTLPATDLARRDGTVAVHAGGWTSRVAAIVATMCALLLFGTDTARADSSSETATRTTTFEKFAFGLTLEPPVLELDRPAVAVAANRPAIVTGTTDPHGRIQVAGTTLEADSRGIFAFVVERPGEGPVEVTATNALGVSTSAAITLRTVPSRVELDAYRAVHIGFCGWSNPEIRNRILTMADEGRINAVQLDIKDEAGHVGYGSRVELARTIGATSGGCRIDLDDAVRTLHSRGIAVIGRVVAFADPLLAAWAWDEGHRDWVIQDVNGGMYRGHYSGFTNFAHLGVIAYNLEIAEEAARSGVDHILWDYIRRPEGRVSTLVFPGLEGTAEDGIVAFVQRADRALAPWGVQHGASVFGIAVTGPTSIAQDIPRMAAHLDYVAPMLYPSHWGPGHFGLSDPVRDPYTVIYESLGQFEQAVAGTRARVIPWLEDTTYRAWDRPLQVREQLRATADRGIDEWLLWNPADRYTPSAIDPHGLAGESSDTGDTDGDGADSS